MVTRRFSQPSLTLKNTGASDGIRTRDIHIHNLALWHINVADARKRAQESLQKAAAGINPIAERKHQAVEQAAVPTVRQVVARYLVEYAKDHMRLDYYKESERHCAST
jgi:hypothetical protein